MRVREGGRRSGQPAVADSGPHRPLTVSVHSVGENGCGLALIDALSDRWGHRQCGDGSEVWAVLPVA
jgi:hypothetical protein